MEHSNSSKLSAVCRDDERRSMMLCYCARVVVLIPCCGARVAAQSCPVSGSAHSWQAEQVPTRQRVGGVGLACDRCDRNASKSRVWSPLRAPRAAQTLLLVQGFVHLQPVAFGAIARRLRAQKEIDCWQQ